MSTRQFPLVRVRGSDEERGYQYGHQQAALVADSLERNYRFWRETAGLDRSACLNFNQHFLPYVRDFAPELIEEMAGIADGVGVAAEEIFFFNFFVDVKYQGVTSPAPPIGANACTTFCATAPATADGGTYVGQNGDFLALYQDNFVLLWEDLGDLRILSIPYAGMVGESGLNSAGLAVVANGLACTDAGEGVPFIILMRKILGERRIGDALSTVMGARRASGTNYVLASATGEIAHVECTGGEAEMLYPRDGAIGHANHLTSPRLRHLDRFHERPGCGNTPLRLSRIWRHLEDHWGMIDLETSKQFLEDHVDYPRSLCRHAEQAGPEVARTKTLFSLVIQPDQGKLHVAAGNPCETEFVEYTV
jgi:isopenicillin-N N-acyltransferase-like protein